jgi:sugar lactone lactonase YvrE
MSDEGGARLNIARASCAANDLGESPYCDVDAGRLYRIDAWRTQVHALDTATDEAWCFDLGSALAGLPIGSIGSHAFRGGAVAQSGPEEKLIRHVRFPVSNRTMCAFGGAGLDIIHVTSASRFLDEAERRGQPLAGHVFAVEGLGARGGSEPRFGT